jgi:hypothetical protein
MVSDQNDSMGPCQRGRPRHGECVFCWDENWTREWGFYFGSRPTMVGPVCKHRLRRARRTTPQVKANRIAAGMRDSYTASGELWMLPYLLPGYAQPTEHPTWGGKR